MFSSGSIPRQARSTPDSRSLFDRFAATIFPDGLTDAVRARFRALARNLDVSAGNAALSSVGHDRICYLASGATKLVAQASNGREQVIAFHFAGELISIPARSAHDYALCALKDCELVVFSADEFLALANREPGLAGPVLERALAALARCREQSIALGRKTAQERVASFLVTIAGRIGRAEAGGCVIDLPMSRRDIGDSLGLTIETVSRQFGELRDRGLLETSGRSIVRLPDPAGLDALAGHLTHAA